MSLESSLVEWHQRLDAWQRRGGTPRWLVYMSLLVYAKILPALAIWIGILIAIIELTSEPNIVMAWIGAAALFFWVVGRVEQAYSRIRGQG